MYFFQNTNPIIFVTFISLFFDFLYQRGYQRWYLLEIKWKSAGIWGIYGLKQGNSLQFFKTLIQLYLFYLFLYFDFLYQRGHQSKYFWTLNLKVLAYEAATAWNRGQGNTVYFFQKNNPIIFVTFISSFFDLLYQRGYQRWDLLEIKWKKCWPIRQLQPETGESLEFFTTLIQLYFFFNLFFTYCIKEGIKGNIFWTLHFKVLAYEAATAWSKR